MSDRFLKVFKVKGEYIPADLFIKHKLPLADSLIYAITLAHKATLWTQDADFKDFPHVRYFLKIQS